MGSGPPENCKHSSRTRLLRNYLTVSMLRYLLSGIVKAVLLHGKSGCFASQDRHFCNTKAPLLLFKGIILTKRRRGRCIPLK